MQYAAVVVVKSKSKEQELVDNITRLYAALLAADEDLLRQWQALQPNFQKIKRTSTTNGRVSQNNNTSQAFQEYIFIPGSLIRAIAE